MLEAYRKGIGVQPKEWDEDGNVTEVVIAFRPEFLVPYILNLENFHTGKLTDREFNLIRRATSELIPEKRN